MHICARKEGCGAGSVPDAERSRQGNLRKEYIFDKPVISWITGLYLYSLIPLDPRLDLIEHSYQCRSSRACSSSDTGATTLSW